VFKVSAYNPLWFGGLKRMSGGEEHYLSSLRLPSIMVFFPFVKGRRNKSREGACYGVALGDGSNELFFPSPADVVGKRKEGGNWRILKFYKDINQPLIKGTLTAFESAEGYLISGNGLKNWKNGHIQEGDLKKWDDFVATELRVGLKIDKHTKTAEESMLYFQERIRLRRDKNTCVNLFFLADGCTEAEGFLKV